MNLLTFNTNRTKEAAEILFSKFNSGEGIFGVNTMPEDMLPEWQLGSVKTKIEKGSYEHRMFITLVVSIDYQRDADQLWEAGRKTFEDESTRWLFYPQELIKRDQLSIINAMRIHRLSKKPEKDAQIWAKVSKSFHRDYASDPLNLVKKYDFDAFRIFCKKGDSFFKQSFPYLSGDKIFPLWIRMMHDNVGLNLKNLEKIPIPIDIHTCRASFCIGAVVGIYSGTIPEVKDKINKSWEEAVALIANPTLTYRLQMDEPLWHLSKNGCTNRKGDLCPVKTTCPVKEYCVNGYVNVTPEMINVDTRV